MAEPKAKKQRLQLIRWIRPGFPLPFGRRLLASIERAIDEKRRQIAKIAGMPQAP